NSRNGQSKHIVRESTCTATQQCHTCSRLVRPDSVIVRQSPPVWALVDDSPREHDSAATTDHVTRAVVYCTHTTHTHDAEDPYISPTRLSRDTSPITQCTNK